MADFTHLPHIKNTAAGTNRWDPVHSIFEVGIHFPAVLGVADDEEALLTQQVTVVNGLDALQKTAAAGEQKFFGVTVSHLQPLPDTTTAEIQMTFNLNLRNTTDNFVLRMFKAWGNLGYDITSGSRTTKDVYADGSINIAEANRDGCIWRAYSFENVMITNITGLNDLDYSNMDARTLQVTFRSDSWTDDIAGGYGHSHTVTQYENGTTKSDTSNTLNSPSVAGRQTS